MRGSDRHTGRYSRISMWSPGCVRIIRSADPGDSQPGAGGSGMRGFGALYAPRFGRPSIPPERLLRAMLLQVFYGICSEDGADRVCCGSVTGTR